MATVMTRDYYEILGVPENASQEQIRKEYLALAKKYHPDKTGGDKAGEEKLKEINDAYSTLKNPEKRKEYDQERTNPFHNAEGFSGFGTGQGFEFEGDYSDVFSSLFGGRGPSWKQAPRRGQNMEIEVGVPFRDIVEGTTRSIRVPSRKTCGRCAGSGAAPGVVPQPCANCRGSGVFSQSSSGFLLRQRCPTCNGSGRVILSPCVFCHGAGTVHENRRVSVRIPAGAHTGLRLRLTGQGYAGEQGAPSGDLFVVVRVFSDAAFERQGNDVVVEIPVSFTDLALGATVRVPTLTGKADVKIPAGTQPGETLRLRGQGLPSGNGRGKGDLLVKATGEAPVRLSQEQRRILEKFRDLEKAGTYPKRQSFQKCKK